MAHLALELDPMNPVREDNRGHATLFGLAVEHHVAVKALNGLPGE
jgi:hypothetical protein